MEVIALKIGTSNECATMNIAGPNVGQFNWERESPHATMLYFEFRSDIKKLLPHPLGAKELKGLEISEQAEVKWMRCYHTIPSAIMKDTLIDFGNCEFVSSSLFDITIRIALLLISFARNYYTYIYIYIYMLFEGVEIGRCPCERFT